MFSLSFSSPSPSPSPSYNKREKEIKDRELWLSLTSFWGVGGEVSCCPCPIQRSKVPRKQGNMIYRYAGFTEQSCEWGKLGDEAVRPAWQRQSKERSERDSLSCLDWLSRTKNWSLSCRDSQGREQREIPLLVWELLAGTEHHTKEFFYTILR